jgi:hypothetical protein
VKPLEAPHRELEVSRGLLGAQKPRREGHGHDH